MTSNSIISRDGTGKYSGFKDLFIPNNLTLPGNSPLLLDFPIDDKFDRFDEKEDAKAKSFDWDHTVGRKVEAIDT